MAVSTRSSQTSVDDVPNNAEFNARTILAANYALNSDIQTLLTRLTALRAGYLDELGPTNMPADIDTLITRLTAARAGYLDNLSAGAVALEATLNAVGVIVSAIPTTPMRGTDGANTVVPDVAGTAATPSEVNAEVVDALSVDTYAEPGKETPAATNSIVGKLGHLYKTLINKKDGDGTTEQLYNSSGTIVDQERSVSELAGTVTKGKMTIGS